MNWLCHLRQTFRNNVKDYRPVTMNILSRFKRGPGHQTIEPVSLNFFLD